MCAPLTLKKPQANVPQDAWGDVVAGSDGVPGGMPYRFVGAMGVRYDSASGLHYMRNRWYDGALQRFVGRDLIRSSNRYLYAGNKPTNFIDPSGLDLVPPPIYHDVVIGAGATHGDTVPNQFPPEYEAKNPFMNRGLDVKVFTRPMQRWEAETALGNTSRLLWISGHAGARGVDLEDGTLVLSGYKGAIRPKIVAISGCNAYYYAQKLKGQLSPGQAFLVFDSSISGLQDVMLRNFFLDEFAQGYSVQEAVDAAQGRYGGNPVVNKAIEHIKIVGDPSAHI